MHGLEILAFLKHVFKFEYNELTDICAIHFKVVIE